MRREKGFTLVELMVVITIIGILVTISIASMGPVRDRAKEARVTAGMEDIVRGLELFAQENRGMYPGVAMPKCDDDGLPPFWDTSGAVPLFTMRGLIGGGTVTHDPTQTAYLDGFYFEVNPPAGTPLQIPDRLVSAGDVERYPTNPFRKNVTGLTNQEIPMLNIWGIEFEAALTDPMDPLGFHLSYPKVYDAAAPGVYNFPSAFDYAGVADFDYWYMGDWRGTVWGADTAGNDFMVGSGELNKYFPEGDFAYIPLDPVETDPTNDQFMRYCKNYWIVVYGAKRSAMKNKFAGVWPHFPRPLGNGIYDPANPSAGMNEFEWAVKNALVGALAVYGTAYTDQLSVAGND